MSLLYTNHSRKTVIMIKIFILFVSDPSYVVGQPNWLSLEISWAVTSGIQQRNRPLRMEKLPQQAHLCLLMVMTQMINMYWQWTMLRKSWLFTRDSGSIPLCLLDVAVGHLCIKMVGMYFKLNPDNKAPLDSINKNAMKRKRKDLNRYTLVLWTDSMSYLRNIMSFFFRVDIPVIIMGETGCGKTKLIDFMSKLQIPTKLKTTLNTMKIVKVSSPSLQLFGYRSTFDQCCVLFW